MSKRLSVALLGFLAAVAVGYAQEQKPLTYAALYESDPRPDFSSDAPRVTTWLDDDGWLDTVDGRPQRIDALTGAAADIYDDQRVALALQSDFGLDETAARRIARRGWQWSDDRATGLAEHDQRLFVLDTASARVRRVGSPKPRELLQISPRGRHASFVRSGDLYTIDLRSGWEHRLTRDGSETRLNGKLDWVYQEEVYGRGRFGAAWWRSDERRLAFLSIDQGAVPEFAYVDNTSDRPTAVTMRYPRPGDPNPVARLGVVAPGGWFVRWIDLSRYGDQPILIVKVGWAPDGRLLCMVQDRAQTWLELCAVAEGARQPRTLIREESPTWVSDPPLPHWLADGSFLWLSERDGWRHIYRYEGDGALRTRVTRGAWDVTEILAVDAGQEVFFAGERDGELETHLYAVSAGGGEARRLTTPGCSHRVSFNPAGTLFADTSSSVATPPASALHRADGTRVRELAGEPAPGLEEFRWAPPTLHRVRTRDGFEINVKLVRPPDFDASSPRPVIVRTYGGPAAPIVRNRWGGRNAMHDHMLAQELGAQVLSVDPRSASGRGAVSAWQAYERLGEQELADIEDAVRWLIARGGADPTRIGITGHSYGGFMTAYALTHSDLFKLGIAGAPVTDWRLYDSIYTERYMNLPARNPEGYRRTSAVEAAANLAGRLFIVHGMVDDNVHFQNAVRLLNALQDEQQMFDVMVYPADRHGIHAGGEHYRRLRFELWRDRL